MNIVILTGGVGTRLWPLGRKNNPKQFFPMISERPLVVETYRRFRSRYPANRIYFSVTKELRRALRQLFPHVPARQFIVEPERRDTAPAMGYAAAWLSLTEPNEPMVFVPADHFILDETKFLDCFAVGEKLVARTGKLVDIGVKAIFPSTVLGYTKIGRKYAVPQSRGVAVYHFAGHAEKPDITAARRYLKTGRYLWHGNYYMWTPAKFLAAFKAHAPGSQIIFQRIVAALKDRRASEVSKLYRRLPKISFDYAITEKLKPAEVLIIKGEFGWSDVGAWDVLHDRLRARGDADGNVTRGAVITADTKESLIYGQPQKIIATLGLKEMIIIDTPDALLICPKNRSQEVKTIIKLLENKGLHKHL